MKNIEFISQEDQELIDRFLNGQLDEASHFSFLERMQKEPGFKDKVEHTRLLAVGIKEESLKEVMIKFHASLPTGKSSKSNWVNLKFVRLAAAAVVLAAVSLVFIVTGKSGEEKLFESYYKADPGLMTTMSESENYNFDRAMVDYKTGNYEQALNGWLKLNQSASSDTLEYFIGSSYLASGEEDEAIKHFDNVLARTESVFYDDASWYKALALLKAKKVDEARKSLQNSSHPRKTDLLSAINKGNE